MPRNEGNDQSDLSRDWYIVSTRNPDGAPLTNAQAKRPGTPTKPYPPNEPAIFPTRSIAVRHITNALGDKDFETYSAQRRGGPGYTQYTTEREKAEYKAVHGRSPKSTQKLSGEAIRQHNLAQLEAGRIVDIVDWNYVGRTAHTKTFKSGKTVERETIAADPHYRAKPCSGCSGKGDIDGQQCKACKGTARSKRNYDELKNVKMPLILDHQYDPKTESNQERATAGQPPLPPGIPWTVEEVIEAMAPAIYTISRKLTGHGVTNRAGFQTSDAISIAMQSILRTLRNDRGMEPFASYCWRAMDGAVNAAARSSGFIRRPGKERHWTDSDVTSLDMPIGSGEGKAGTIGDIVPAGTPVITMVQCPTCDNNQTKKKGCRTCKGRGKVPQATPRETIYTDFGADSDLGYTMNPLQMMQHKERSAKAKSIWDNIITAAKNLPSALSLKQEEVFRMRHGLDGTGVEKDFVEIVNIMLDKYGLGTTVGIKNLYSDATKKIEMVKSVHPEYKDAIDTFANRHIRSYISACDRCNGEGTTTNDKNKGKSIVCPDCKGEGYVDIAQMEDINSDLYPEITG